MQGFNVMRHKAAADHLNGQKEQQRSVGVTGGMFGGSGAEQGSCCM